MKLLKAFGFVVGAVALFTVLLAVPYVGTTNAGFVVGTEQAHVGLEVYGPDGAGLFVDVGDWQWAQGQK